jgi:hypothetical protein
VCMSVLKLIKQGKVQCLNLYYSPLRFKNLMQVNVSKNSSFVDNTSLIFFLRNVMLCALIAKLPTNNRLFLPPTPMEVSIALKNTIKMVRVVYSFFIYVVFHRSVNVLKMAWFQSCCICEQHPSVIAIYVHMHCIPCHRTVFLYQCSV